MKSTTKAMILTTLILTSSILSGCTRIGPGHVGVKVSMAGDEKGVDAAPAVTGWVFYNPFLSSVYEWPTFVQQVVLTKDPNEGNPSNEEITFTNADQMMIAADISFAYSLESDKVPNFYVKFRTDDMHAFSHGYLRSLIRDKFNEIGGRYKIEQIMGDNAEFIAEVKAAVQKDVAAFGVILEPQFGFIGAPRPPHAVIESINNKIQAVQIAQQKQNELVQSQADAAKGVAKTEGYAKEIMLRATAEAAANRLLSESISANLLELKRLEKWNGVLPQVSGSGAIPMFNVKQ